jgi:hypothetical protein
VAAEHTPAGTCPPLRRLSAPLGRDKRQSQLNILQTAASSFITTRNVLSLRAKKESMVKPHG